MKEEKMRKFAYKQAQNNQTQNSTTEATLILCGYLGSRANIKFLISSNNVNTVTTYRGMYLTKLVQNPKNKNIEQGLTKEMAF